MSITIHYPKPLNVTDMKEGDKFYTPYFHNGLATTLSPQWRIDGNYEGIEYYDCPHMRNLIESNLAFDSREKAMQFIKAVKNANANNGWIDIKKQLPKTDERVLIFVPKTERNSGFEQHIAVRLNKYKFVLQDNFLHEFDIKQISHWQPLPDLPKQGI